LPNRKYGTEVFLSSKTSETTLGSIIHPIQWITGFVPGMKWPGPELNHLHPSSAEVKNERSYTSIPPFQ